jgi:hypothetical protein
MVKTFCAFQFNTWIQPMERNVKHSTKFLINVKCQGKQKCFKLFFIFETKDANSLFRARSQINKFKNTGQIQYNFNKHFSLTKTRVYFG